MIFAVADKMTSNTFMRKREIVAMHSLLKSSI